MTEYDKHHFRAAEGWLGLVNWQQANAELEEMVPLVRATAPVLALRCRIYEAAKKWQTARDIGRLVAETRSANAELLLALARCECALGDSVQGRKWLKLAIGKNGSKELKLRVLEDKLLGEAMKSPD